MPKAGLKFLKSLNIILLKQNCGTSAHLLMMVKSIKFGVLGGTPDTTVLFCDFVAVATTTLAVLLAGILFLRAIKYNLIEKKSSLTSR